MKRLLVLALVLVFTLTNVGCGSIMGQLRKIADEQNQEDSSTTTEAETTESTEEVTEATDTEESEDDVKPTQELVVEGAPLIHDFELSGDLSDSITPGTELVIHPNTGNNRFIDGVWQWTADQHPGGGLILLTDQISNPENYSIGFRIKFNDVGPSWKKILSFREESVDGGLYFSDGKLQLYPFNVDENITYSANTFYDFILSREANKMMTVYVVQDDGSITKVYEEQDLRDESVPVLVDGKYQFMFFTDDYSTTAEWTTGGSVDSIRLWNGFIDEVRFD